MSDCPVNFEQGEFGLELANGSWLVTHSAEQNLTGVDYIRVVAKSGREVGYWIADEWRDEPETVMGAIVGSLSAGEDY